MKVDDKIRKLLEKAIDCAKDSNIKKKITIDEKQAYKWIMQDMFGFVDQALSLLPKPCSECGGSGEVKPFPIDVPKLAMTCPKCQAPAGEIEEFVKNARNILNQPIVIEECAGGDAVRRIPRDYSGWLLSACTHLEALLKQIKGLEKTNNEFADGIETVNAACVKKTRLLQSQIKQLEGEALELMLEMVKGSKGERQRINAELLEKRRADFGIQKGGADAG